MGMQHGTTSLTAKVGCHSDFKSRLVQHMKQQQSVTVYNVSTNISMAFVTSRDSYSQLKSLINSSVELDRIIISIFQERR